MMNNLGKSIQAVDVDAIRPFHGFEFYYYLCNTDFINLTDSIRKNP